METIARIAPLTALLLRHIRVSALVVPLSLTATPVSHPVRLALIIRVALLATQLLFEL